jgi:hypothetical protein
VSARPAAARRKRRRVGMRGGYAVNVQMGAGMDAERGTGLMAPDEWRRPRVAPTTERSPCLALACPAPRLRGFFPAAGAGVGAGIELQHRAQRPVA